MNFKVGNKYYINFRDEHYSYEGEAEYIGRNGFRLPVVLRYKGGSTNFIVVSEGCYFRCYELDGIID